MSKYQMIAPKINSMPWQEAPKEGNRNTPLWRYSENPIIDRNPIPGVARIFNSAVMPYQGAFVGVFRGEQTDGISFIYLGHSKDAIHWEFEKEKITKTELFDMRFRRLFEKCGRDTNGVDFLKINSDFIDCMLHSGVAMEGACDFIKKVAVNIPDVRIYIITNGAERNARGRLASTGMNAYVCEMFVSETMGTAKPSREFFDIVKKAIGEPDESCIVIGDSLTSDMLGARNSGLVSCWFMPEGNIEEAVKEYDINYTASSFDELYEVITRWSVTCFPYTALEDQ